MSPLSWVIESLGSRVSVARRAINLLLCHGQIQAQPHGPRKEDSRTMVLQTDLMNYKVLAWITSWYKNHLDLIIRTMLTPGRGSWGSSVKLCVLWEPCKLFSAGFLPFTHSMGKILNYNQEWVMKANEDSYLHPPWSLICIHTI